MGTSGQGGAGGGGARGGGEGNAGVEHAALGVALGVHPAVWGELCNIPGTRKLLDELRDMARLGLLLTHDGYYDGQQVVDADWVYKMTHPAFEDANNAYGYLTWLIANDNWTFAGLIGDAPRDKPRDK